MSGRHREGSGRYAGKHRAPRPAPRRGLVSLAAVTALTGIGGAAAAYYAVQGSGAASRPPAGQQQSAAARILSLTEHTLPARGTTPGAPANRPSANRHERRNIKRHKQNLPTDVLLLQTFGGRSWVQIATGNGQQLADRMLGPHQQLRINRHHLTVTLGNAGAVGVVVNGHRLGRAGQLGQVRNFSVR